MSGESAMSAAPEVRVTRGAVPTEEEMVAIVAAVQVTMSSAAVPALSPEPSPRWRFSGRWWSKPVASRRERPSAV